MCGSVTLEPVIKQKWSNNTRNKNDMQMLSLGHTGGAIESTSMINVSGSSCPKMATWDAGCPGGVQL